MFSKQNSLVLFQATATLRGKATCWNWQVLCEVATYERQQMWGTRGCSGAIIQRWVVMWKETRILWQNKVLCVATFFTDWFIFLAFLLPHFKSKLTTDKAGEMSALWNQMSLQLQKQSWPIFIKIHSLVSNSKARTFSEHQQCRWGWIHCTLDANEDTIDADLRSIVSCASRFSVSSPEVTEQVSLPVLALCSLIALLVH